MKFVHFNEISQDFKVKNSNYEPVNKEIDVPSFNLSRQIAKMDTGNE